jgi:synaptojanin
MWTEMGDYLSR